MRNATAARADHRVLCLPRGGGAYRAKAQPSSAPADGKEKQKIGLMRAPSPKGPLESKVEMRMSQNVLLYSTNAATYSHVSRSERASALQSVTAPRNPRGRLNFSAEGRS